MPITDTESFAKAGVPQTKKMVKYGNTIDQNGKTVRPDLEKYNLNYDSLFRIMKEQNRIETIERYMWIDLPPGLTADLIERILYYRGKGILYYNDKVNKFQFLPFALNGNIDEYGRYLKCNTLPFTGVDTEEKEEKDNKKPKMENLVYQDLEIVYDLPYNEETLKEIRDKKVVGIILNDSSLSLNQQPIIRSNYVLPVVRMMATLMQIINTAMFGAADHSLLKIENESELSSIEQQIKAINNDIIKGQRFTPITSQMAIETIKSSNTADLEGLFGTFNSLTNFLKSITGVANAGVFDKKAHLLQEEQKLNGSNSDDIYYNGLRMRQEFCLMIQAYYGYPTWCASKRGMSEAQEENYLMGETPDPDNTTGNNNSVGEDDGSV